MVLSLPVDVSDGAKFNNKANGALFPKLAFAPQHFLPSAILWLEPDKG
jgi:hypothetical protein